MRKSYNKKISRLIITGATLLTIAPTVTPMVTVLANTPDTFVEVSDQSKFLVSVKHKDTDVETNKQLLSKNQAFMNDTLSTPLTVDVVLDDTDVVVSKVDFTFTDESSLQTLNDVTTKVEGNKLTLTFDKLPTSTDFSLYHNDFKVYVEYELNGEHKFVPLTVSIGLVSPLSLTDLATETRYDTDYLSTLVKEVDVDGVTYQVFTKTPELPTKTESEEVPVDTEWVEETTTDDVSQEWVDLTTVEASQEWVENTQDEVSQEWVEPTTETTPETTPEETTQTDNPTEKELNVQELRGRLLLETDITKETLAKLTDEELVAVYEAHQKFIKENNLDSSLSTYVLLLKQAFPKAFEEVVDPSEDELVLETMDKLPQEFLGKWYRTDREIELTVDKFIQLKDTKETTLDLVGFVKENETFKLYLKDKETFLTVSKSGEDLVIDNLVYTKEKVNSLHSRSEKIPFQVVERENTTLPKGTRNLIQQGQDGVKEIHYSIDKETGKEVIVKETVSKQPVDEIYEVGSKVDTPTVQPTQPNQTNQTNQTNNVNINTEFRVATVDVQDTNGVVIGKKLSLVNSQNQLVTTFSINTGFNQVSYKVLLVGLQDSQGNTKSYTLRVEDSNGKVMGEIPNVLDSHQFSVTSTPILDSSNKQTGAIITVTNKSTNTFTQWNVSTTGTVTLLDTNGNQIPGNSYQPTSVTPNGTTTLTNSNTNNTVQPINTNTSETLSSTNFKFKVVDVMNERNQKVSEKLQLVTDNGEVSEKLAIKFGDKTVVYTIKSTPKTDSYGVINGFDVLVVDPKGLEVAKFEVIKRDVATTSYKVNVKEVKGDNGEVKGYAVELLDHTNNVVANWALTKEMASQLVDTGSAESNLFLMLGGVIVVIGGVLFGVFTYLDKKKKQ